MVFSLIIIREQHDGQNPSLGTRAHYTLGTFQKKPTDELSSQHRNPHPPIFRERKALGSSLQNKSK